MASIAVCALLLAMWRTYVLSYQAELRTIARIKALGDGTGQHGQVFTEARGQYFFRQLFGDQFSQRAVYVHLFDEKVNDNWLRDNLSDLQHVEYLTISSPNVTDRGLSCLVRLKSLRQLTLDRTQVTAAGVDKLRLDLPSLMRVTRQP
jgi:hypothetical protein